MLAGCDESVKEQFPSLVKMPLGYVSRNSNVAQPSMTSLPAASMQPMDMSGVAVVKELELRTEIVPRPLSVALNASPGSRAAAAKRAVMGVNIVVDRAVC